MDSLSPQLAWHVLVLATLLGIIIRVFVRGHWIVGLALSVITVVWAVRVVRESGLAD